MDDGKEMKLARELLTAMVAGLLNAMKMTNKYDTINIDVLFSPQVFNPEYRNKKRRNTFIINVCITPFEKERADG